MKKCLAVFAAFAAAVVSARISRAAPDKVSRCRRAIISTSKVLEREVDNLNRCEFSALKGKTAAHPSCRGGDFPRTNLASSRLERKVARKIRMACCGSDKTCGTDDDVNLGAVGWNMNICPDRLARQITDFGGVARCIAGVGRMFADEIADLTFDNYFQNARGRLRNCQKRPAKSASKFLKNGSGVFRKCAAKNRFARHITDCPLPDDAETHEEITGARIKFRKPICRVCGGRRNGCGEGNDFDPRQIGVKGFCPNATIPGGRSCFDENIGNLDDWANCLECNVEARLRCFAALTAPHTVNGYPSVCLRQIVAPGESSTTTSTSTTSTTSTTVTTTTATQSTTTMATTTTAKPTTTTVRPTTTTARPTTTTSQTSTTVLATTTSAPTTTTLSPTTTTLRPTTTTIRVTTTTTTTIPRPVCGNGVIENGEQCDDGNSQNGDCCSANCRFENLGFAYCGRGECERVVPACAHGHRNNCVPGAPSWEACANGLDDDCDGYTDCDDFDCAWTQRCMPTTTTTLVTATTSPSTTSTTYDPRDSDDDGDGFTENQGDCDDSEPNIYPGASEACNNIDDDCDGAVDEGLPDYGNECQTGLFGACAEGMTICNFPEPPEPHYIACVQLYAPVREKCGDGIDNDCDGEVDENGCR